MYPFYAKNASKMQEKYYQGHKKGRSGGVLQGQKKTHSSHLASMTATVCQVSDSHVRKVMRMGRNNDIVVKIYMDLAEKTEQMIEAATEKAKLLEESKKLVPFN